MADVGTDHCAIPVYLALRGDCAPIFATDIRPGPLASAKAAAQAAGVSDRISFRLCDGLRQCPKTDTVVVAGMGGETMIHILLDAPWTRSETELLLIPHSKPELLSRWLGENGYEIAAARLVEDDGRLYHLWRVRGSETASTPEGLAAYIPREAWDDPLFPAYRAQLEQKLRRELSGLSRSRTPEPERTARLAALLRELEQQEEQHDTG